MTTPETRLASRGWRWRHSVWLLGPILGFGFGTVFSLLWAGRKLRDATVTRVAVLLIAPTAFIWVVIGTSKPQITRTVDTAAGVILVTIWIAGSIYAARINRRLLRIRAGQEIVPWYKAPQQQSSHPSQAPATWGQPAGQQWQGALGLTDIQEKAWTPPPTATPPPPTTPAEMAPQPSTPNSTAPAFAAVDVNAADEDALRRLPGVGPALAKRVIAYRDSNRGLRAPEDLAAAGLPPHILAGVVGLVTFGPYRSGVQPSRGRVLDI